MGQVFGFQNYEDILSVALVPRLLSPLHILFELRDRFRNIENHEDHSKCLDSFVDLRILPPELAFNILSNLNATDLCLASGVWYNLALDEQLWQGLCKAVWPFCSAYTNGALDSGLSYRQLYLRLDEACLTFNADAFEGMEYMFKYKLLDDKSDDLINFFRISKGLKPLQKRRFLDSRPQLLASLINLKDYCNQSLPNLLRHIFEEFPAPLRGPESIKFMHKLVTIFSSRFAICNMQLGLSNDDVYILCFSIIMLSVDFWSPHIKNKMSKREFIRNTRQVVERVTDDFLVHLYDNVYIVGHVVLNEYRGSPVQLLKPSELVVKA